ncbi:hypothetical protein Tco_1273544 [Tanacetum coccineum]
MNLYNSFVLKAFPYSTSDGERYRKVDEDFAQVTTGEGTGGMEAGGSAQLSNNAGYRWTSLCRVLWEVRNKEDPTKVTTTLLEITLRIQSLGFKNVVALETLHIGLSIRTIWHLIPLFDILVFLGISNVVLLVNINLAFVAFKASVVLIFLIHHLFHGLDHLS